jgi:hypothetical protein
MTRDLRQELAANATQRAELTAALTAAERQERDLIAAAWRERIGPGEIAKAAGRSGAHVRKFRPEDVPPARTGGNAAPKRRRKKVAG